MLHQGTRVHKAAITIQQLDIWRTGISGFASIDRSNEAWFISQHLNKYRILSCISLLAYPFYDSSLFSSSSPEIVMRSNVSKASSPFLPSVPHAPTPPINSWSLSGTRHVNEDGRRRATNTNMGPSREPRRVQLAPSECPPSRGLGFVKTGSNVNHNPNADQKGASLTRLRTL